MTSMVRKVAPARPAIQGSLDTDATHLSRLIPLTKGYVAIVDEADYEALATYCWQAQEARRPARIGHRRVYAMRGGGIRMHRQIVGAPRGVPVDHINGDGLDNRRSNLRPSTTWQNVANQRYPRLGTSSRFKGVSWAKRERIWEAYIKVHRRKINLGSFSDEIQAAYAYDRAAKQFFGEFAAPNFPESV